MQQPEHTPRGPSGVSRREFLKGSGAAAATAIAVGADAVAEAAPKKKEPKLFGSGTSQIILQINTHAYLIQVETRTTLLEVLRHQLSLTGAKPVDPAGLAGASTVLLDDEPVNASTLLAISCIGRTVTTAEGLVPKKPTDPPDPLLAAFVDHDASQCGFCTPGFVLAVKAFLKQNPRPSEEQVRAGLGGNLCRCGTYANIIQAIGSLSKGSHHG
jgi:aerobic-type carbon monoxide dehydrogenase small subunit (CoxS/CutS family)